jgi:WYL domain
VVTRTRQPVPAELAAALLGRHRVSFTYARDPRVAGPRVVSPHAVYRTRTGKICLQGVQVAGHTSHGAGSLPDWRTFELGLMSGVRKLSEPFEVSEEFHPGSPAYRRMIIDCLRGWINAGQPKG